MVAYRPARHADELVVADLRPVMSLTDLRHRMIEVTARSGEGHLPSAFSVLEIIHTLYGEVMTEGDRFVLSKAHASLALYAVLEDRGILPSGTLDTFCQRGSILGGHPDMRKVPGVEASTGSLGHGLPIAVGMALARPESRVFCLVGDQECNEGSIWESALVAAHRKLSNLTCVVDFNGSGEAICRVDSVGMKFAAFGWDVDLCSGHAPASLKAILAQPRDRPFCLVAGTVKGYGSKIMEADPRAWHHRSPKNADETRALMVAA